MSTAPPPHPTVLRSYAPLTDVYDELVTAAGAPRPHAVTFADAINRLGRDEFANRWELSQRLVHENGLAYAGHVTQDEKPRPWELDAIPLIIPAAEWQAVSIALAQRARLLNLILRDLYGPQQLLKTKVLPPEFVFAHPGFLFPYHGQRPAHDCFLNFYAADLARSPDGSWWVLADRTEAPSGLGYALENRIVISRMLPDVFRECSVQRLAPFFQTVQETLRGLAPAHRENPRVVLLSDGPASLNYFEDAYLARYLGFALVEGGDLAVRNGSVMLKTLGGLLPVDVIFRRQNSRSCDPLELASNSVTGVAGLTQAARAGKVAIANQLGSGLVESTVFMAFMPQLCQAILGEPLLMPGVATHWCGSSTGLSYVLKNLERLTIYPAFRRRGKDSPTRQSLSDMPLGQLAETIKKNPNLFAAQEKVVRSTAPTWRDELRSSHVALRAYLVSNNDSYEVMPGALARVSETLDPLEMSLRKGEGSKDAWVLAEGPVDHTSLLDKPGKSVGLSRSSADLPSRAADNLLWLGRYFERADATARLLRSTASRLIGETRFSSTIELPVLLRCLADQGQIEAGYAVEKIRNQLPSIETVLPSAAFDPAQPASMRSVLNELLRLGSIIRDRVSLDTWRIIRGIDEGFQPARRGATNLSDLLAMTDDLMTGLAALGGAVTESMTRTQAFRFVELGRRMERSLQMISLIKNFFVPMPKIHGPVLETILEVADSLMTYRSRYLANLELAAVLDLLLTDETNPRSLAYQFERLEEHVNQLPRDDAEPGYSRVQRIAMKLTHSIRLLDVQSLAETHCLCDYSPLEELTHGWELELPRLSESISLRYLVHAGQARQMSEIQLQ